MVLVRTVGIWVLFLCLTLSGLNIATSESRDVKVDLPLNLLSEALEDTVVEYRVVARANVPIDESPFTDSIFGALDSAIVVDLDVALIQQDLSDVTAPTTYMPSLTAYFEPETGKLIKAVLSQGPLDPDIHVEFTPQEAAHELRSVGEEYRPAPETVGVTLEEAVAACRYNPLTARKTVIQLVTLKVVGKGARPAWIFQSIGLHPPLTPIGPAGVNEHSIPIYQLNRVRQVVDAVTGNLLFTSTVPAPPLRPEDRERLFPGVGESIK